MAGDARFLVSDAARPPIDWLVHVNRHALVSRLLATTIHDLNNTLQVVSGAAELLAIDPTPDAIVRRTSAIVSQAHRATSALQAVTAFARGTDHPVGRARLRTLADEALGLRILGVRKGRIDVSVSGDEVECAASPRRVLQVLLNLIANADQALVGAQGAELRVHVAAGEIAATVTVADNGPGVPGPRAATLFDWPPPLDEHTSALGIGLLVSRALAAADGGDVSYAPRVGGGAAFVLSLPRS